MGFYQYNYSATQNNGRILSQTDVVSGESVTYAYDTLNRLTGASGVSSGSGGSGSSGPAPNTSWSQAFTYDGFGNSTQKSGSNAPNNMLLTADPTTNRLTGNGAGYDANGNLSANGTGSYAVSYSYDIENRMSAAGSGGVTQAVFGYDQGNQRVYQGTYNTSTAVYSNEQIYFYGADGKKLAVYSLAASGSGYTLTASQTKVWFGGRILAPEDRLESQGTYFPYGEDRYSPSPANPSNDTEKFATYTRDSATGLDYAYQRYYESAVGRFHTVDPYAGSARAGNPQTWNRYSYADGDAANHYDPTGLFARAPGWGGDPDFNSSTEANNFLVYAWITSNQFLNQTPSNGGGAASTTAAINALNKIAPALNQAAKGSIFDAATLECISGIETGLKFNANNISSNGRTGLFQFNAQNWAASGTTYKLSTSNAENVSMSASVAEALLYRKLGYSGVENPTPATVTKAIDQFGEGDGHYGPAVTKCAQQLNSGIQTVLLPRFRVTIPERLLTSTRHHGAFTSLAD